MKKNASANIAETRVSCALNHGHGFEEWNDSNKKMPTQIERKFGSIEYVHSTNKKSLAINGKGNQFHSIHG